jgi:hypothetical protein
MNERELSAALGRLSGQLERAISQAIDHPALFCESGLPNEIESECSALLDAVEEKQLSKGTSALRSSIWEIRGQAGRLQKLMDSASQFYASCFSAQPCEGLAYGVHGEWGAVAQPGHLSVDC